MFKYNILLYLTFLYFQCALGSIINRNDDLVVQTNVGLIRGVRPDEGDYTMFMGIPYATVNDSNVFGNSIPHPPFEGIFDANDDSAICPQIEEFNFTTVGNLDCLHLNVYVPDSASSQNRLPVMVYIYGGGFNIGYAGRFLYGPKYIVRHDVIMVTINYRLGPYGFFCLDTPEVSGNQGLKDQVTALRWIRNNIEAFGGDSNSVTLFGNSAGAMSIGFHLISETEMLFTRAIMQSGSAFYPNLLYEPNNNSPIETAAALGYSTNDVNEALTFLANADVHAVVEASASVGVCVEIQFTGVERLIGEHAIISDHSKASGIDIMLGYNNDELLNVFPGESGSWAGFENIFLDTLNTTFNFDFSLLEELTSIVRRFYIGDEEVTSEVRKQILDFSGDFLFIYPSIRSIKYFFNANVNKVYQYLFAYDGDRNFVKRKDNINTAGVAHADEIGYLFKMDFMPEQPTPEDQLIIDRMTEMWANFAKYGDPTPQTTTLLPVKWEPITENSPYHYIVIDSTMSSGQRFEHRRMTFWDLFYSSYETYEVGYSNRNEDSREENTEESTEESSEDESIEVDSQDSSENEPDSSSIAYINSVLISALALFILVT